MNMIDFRAASAQPIRRGKVHVGGRQHRINGAIAYGLIAFLAFVPIPLGSNRPFFWGMSAILIGLTGLEHAILLYRAKASARVPVSGFPVIAGLWGIVCAWLIVQTIPLGSLVLVSTQDAVFERATISLAPGETLHMLARMASYGLFFYLVLQVSANRERAEFFLKALFTAIVAYAAYGLMALTQFDDTLLFFEKWAYEGSATGTFVNRNSYATFLAFGVVIGMILTLKAAFGSGAKSVDRAVRSRSWEVALYSLGTVFTIAALAATQSRMGLASGIAGSAVVTLMAGAKLHTQRPAGRRAGFILAAILFLVSLMLFGAGTLERLGNAEHDFDVRSQLYMQILHMIAERPLLGFGGGSFEIAYPLFHQPPVSPDRVWDKAHSTYLALWSELGLVFGTLPILIISAIAWRCLYHFYKRERDFWLPLAALGVTIVAGLHSLVDFSLEIQANTFYFLAVLGLGFAHFRQPGRT